MLCDIISILLIGREHDSMTGSHKMTVLCYHFQQGGHPGSFSKTDQQETSKRKMTPKWNKPSFWDKFHGRTKLQNKTSLKHSWNTLKLFLWNCLETQLTLSLNTLGTALKCLWNCLETPLKHSFTSLRYHWCYLESPLKVSRKLVSFIFY